MVFPCPRRLNPEQALTLALSYSRKFSFPLTLDEVWLWQFCTIHPRQSFLFWPHQKNGFFFLPGQEKLVSVRRRRQAVSRRKIIHARSMAGLLRFIPTVQAVFLTGSLAVGNSRADDDIDFMIITSPHTLWLTRALVVAFLSIFSRRRSPGLPEHSSARVSDKICDNLYLDESFLSLPHNPASFARCFYLGHEILQAKVMWARSGIDSKFINANSWVSELFPMAFQARVKSMILSPSAPGFSWTSLLFPLNLLFFFFQYLRMRPRFTRETIALKYAFFHPRSGVNFPLIPFLSSIG